MQKLGEFIQTQKQLILDLELCGNKKADKMLALNIEREKRLLKLAQAIYEDKEKG